MKRAFSDKPVNTPEAILERLDWCGDVLAGREDVFKGLAALEELARHVHSLSVAVHHLANRASTRAGVPLESLLVPLIQEPVVEEKEPKPKSKR